ADRLDRRRFLVASNLVEAFLAALLAVLTVTGHTSPALVTGVVLVAGCVTATSMPFVASLLPDLVPAEDLLGAVSLNSAQWNVGRVVGPALAAGVVALGSYSLAFAINAVSFGATIVAYWLLPLDRPAPVSAPERPWPRPPPSASTPGAGAWSRPWPAWPWWARATSPFSRDSTPWSSCGPPAPTGPGCSASSWSPWVSSTAWVLPSRARWPTASAWP